MHVSFVITSSIIIIRIIHHHQNVIYKMYNHHLFVNFTRGGGSRYARLLTRARARGGAAKKPVLLSA
jgi:hypothetical protein